MQAIIVPIPRSPIAKFVSLWDFRARTAQVRRDLIAEHEFVLTANGRPVAILAEVTEDDFEERLKALRRARDLALLGRIGVKAKARGVDKMTMAEIDAEIAQARRERQPGK